MNNNMFEACLNEHNKLDGSNYANWKFKMQTLLDVQSAWTIVNGDEPKPRLDQHRSQIGRNEKVEQGQC